jgi:hypothetical protein
MFNEISASLGQPALYPFVLSLPAVRKLRFVHYVASEGHSKPQPAAAVASPLPAESAAPAPAPLATAGAKAQVAA